MEKDLVQYIAENLVNEPDKVRVRSRRARDSVIVQLNVARADMGRVIGKQGRVANAIRSLLKVAGQKNDTRVILDID
ncbi:MAG: KH domain-containing protein [Anaerolineaceae bacterium]|nr:MAG: KH domain-containing protein [Anaerolineaceae bacterium]